MLLRLARIASACAILTAFSFGVASAQAAPSAAPTPANDRAGSARAQAKPPSGWDPLRVKGLTFSGTLRAYDFNRINTPEYNPVSGTQTGPNRAAFNFGGDLRADYKIGDTPLSIGGAFWGAYPFGLDGGPVGCNVGGTLVVNQPQALCGKNNGGFDNTLPGYPLETFEYYLKYADKTANVTIGDFGLNKTWFPSSDSRIKPALYQGADATIKLSPYISVGATVVTRFENRTQSTFTNCTLLSCDGSATPAQIGAPFVTKAALVTGADRFAVTFKPNPDLTVDGEYYTFLNTANLTYVDARYALGAGPLRPFIAGQFVGESAAGKSVVGKVDNQTSGVQLGVTPVKNVVFTVGANDAPWNYATVCAASATAATAGYFLPGGGTGSNVTATSSTTTLAVPIQPCALAGGKAGEVYRFAYGGIASPYSDSYASDPLYTTSISQGMVDRRSAGSAAKATLTYTSSNKQFIALLSEAAYNYDTTYAANRTYEFDADVAYDFNRVRAGGYRGFSIRERFADRTGPTLPFHFLYLRHQLQYTF